MRSRVIRSMLDLRGISGLQILQTCWLHVDQAVLGIELTDCGALSWCLSICLGNGGRVRHVDSVSFEVLGSSLVKYGVMYVGN